MSGRSVLRVWREGVRRSLQTMASDKSSASTPLIKITRQGITTGVARWKSTLVSPKLQPVAITKTFPTSHQSLRIGFEDNLTSDFQYIWLRDNCRCPRCVHPENKQKLLDTVGLDINVKPSTFHVTDEGKLHVVWPEPGGGEHTSLYDPLWLHKYGKHFGSSWADADEELPPITTWSGAQLHDRVPEVTYDDVMRTEEGLNAWLDHIYKYGIAIIRGVPCEQGEVVRVMERVAYIKRTKWGSSFDVRCEPVQSDPDHLAYTGMYLEHHTDMNYLEKSPGLQALHCLKANPSIEGASIGGQSFFVDGFHVAEWMRQEHPSSFHVLASTLVEFKIKSHNMEYSNRQFVLCANKSGELQEVHYNTRTMAPLKGPPEAVQPFYEAYKLMGMKMREKESELAFNLVPGDLVAFNNRRVLHGRTSFDPRRMSRHLEGCYGDIDEVLTRYRASLQLTTN